MAETYCPASMCPLIAPDGSPWTGQKNARCPQKHSMDPSCGCAWFQGFGGAGCDGASSAHEQIAEAAEGHHVLQLGPRRKKRERAAPRDYDCPRSHDCQWQAEAEAEGGLCPPRTALRLGLDPRLAAY